MVGSHVFNSLTAKRWSPVRLNVALLPMWETLEIHTELSLKRLKGGGHLGIDKCVLLQWVLEKSGLKFRT